MTSHPNRGWRSRWTVQRDARVAVHVTGVRVLFRASPTRPGTHDQITIEGTDRVPAGTDVGRLVEEAMRIWLEGVE